MQFRIMIHDQNIYQTASCTSVQFAFKLTEIFLRAFGFLENSTKPRKVSPEPKEADRLEKELSVGP